MIPGCLKSLRSPSHSATSLPPTVQDCREGPGPHTWWALSQHWPLPSADCHHLVPKALPLSTHSARLVLPLCRGPNLLQTPSGKVPSSTFGYVHLSGLLSLSWPPRCKPEDQDHLDPDVFQPFQSSRTSLQNLFPSPSCVVMGEGLLPLEMGVGEIPQNPQVSWNTI